MKRINYVDTLLAEWKIKPGTLRRAVGSVLRCLHPTTLLILRNEPRLQVEIHNWFPETWAYFPIRKGQIGDEHLNIQLDLIVHACKIKLRPEAEILLVLKNRRNHHQKEDDRRSEIAHHIGHVLLYLRDPKAKNTCATSRREWRRNLNR